MDGSAQAATEYMLVAGVILIIVIPTAFIFYRQASDSADEIDHAQIDKFGRDVISNAESVYYLGPPSRITIEERLPNNVENITILRDASTGVYILQISVKTKGGVSDFTYPTKVNIAGAFTEEGISAGIKQVRIQAGPFIGATPFVTVNLKGNDTTCVGGTITHNSCLELLQPQICYNGALIDNCETCGCGAGTCLTNGSCQ